MSASLCNARVAGAQGGFCRNEVVPGSRYCEVHDDAKPSLRNDRDREQEQKVWAVARELSAAIEQAAERLSEAGLTADEAGELLSECVVMAHWGEHFDD